jgi:thymidylate kinase
MCGKQTVIIFDGPDRCGKTEISKELSKRLCIPRFKNEKEKQFFANDEGYFVNSLRYGDPYFVSYLKQSGASVILDRSFPSEYVYSSVMGRETDSRVLRAVDEMYAGIGTTVIVPYRTSYDGIKDDQFDVLDSNKLRQIHDKYEEFIAWTKCDTLHLCVDDEDLDREIRDILFFLDEDMNDEYAN